MILEKLSVINYKNIAAATLELSPKINCLIGQNGVGKTNVLDAIYFLSFCHSASTPIDSQVIRHGEEFFMLEGSYDEDMHIIAAMKKGAKKHFKRNKKEYKRLSEHIGLIPIVVVAPSDTLLIEGGSEERRRLMDMVISQYDRSYIDAMNRYNKALQQRNALLKLEEEPDNDVISLFEEQMAVEGEKIYQRRKAFIEELVIHAEGDEYKVNTEKIQERFSDDMINKLMPGCYDMLCSMLKDLSPYGIEGRENQTDDLSLTINMGSPVPAGIHDVARSVDSKCCYDLNGRLLQAPPAKGLYIRGGRKQMK